MTNIIWRTAQHSDVENIIDMADHIFGQEVDNIFRTSRTRMGFHLHKGILESTYLKNQLIMVAYDGNRLVAWNWISRGSYTVYSDDECAVAEFAHVDLSLSPRQRIALLKTTLEQWIAWAYALQIPVICSTSIRAEQTGFMRLHERLGFTVRGSFAYMRVVK